MLRMRRFCKNSILLTLLLLAGLVYAPCVNSARAIRVSSDSEAPPSSEEKTETVNNNYEVKHLRRPFVGNFKLRFSQMLPYRQWALCSKSACSKIRLLSDIAQQSHWHRGHRLCNGCLAPLTV